MEFTFDTVLNDIHLLEESDLFLHSIKQKIMLLKNNGIENIIFVFDGKKNNIKACTNDDRKFARNKRIDSANDILTKLKAIKQTEENHEEISKLKNKYVSTLIESLSITQTYIDKTIDLIKTFENTIIINAPFEADPQLAYLYKTNKIHAIITEGKILLIHYRFGFTSLWL